MQPPKSVTDLISLLDQVIFEFEELAVCAEEDLDDELYDYAEEFKRMADAMKVLKSQLDGKSAFVNSQGIDFIRRAKVLRPIIPFFGVVEAIDTACRQGVSEHNDDVR